MADVDPRDLEQTEPKDEGEAEPFFARFLENQNRVRTGVKAGKVPPTTAKFPSDRDESTTLKYPSDDDEAYVSI